MKIVKTKTYNKIIQQNDMLTKQILKQQGEISLLKRTNIDLGNRFEYLCEEFSESKKEIKRLKTLLTKNKIEYKKEGK